MSDRALVRAGMAGAILAAICCVAPLLAVGLPLAGLGSWLIGADLVVLPLMIAGLGLVVWSMHHRRARAASANMKVPNERVKP
ncbi:mercury transport protein [Vineibacter terrae]|uniref:Mercury transport protein n=1 Tax=Vineibacter terrae TaxID=2586908 RepID=A0A5C8PFG7_9HYPH|nr:mercury transport protein [Vineibacter terrae]